MYNIYSDNCNKKACIHKYTTFKLKPLINCYCITKYFQFKLICTVELKVWIPSDIFPFNAILTKWCEIFNTKFCIACVLRHSIGKCQGGCKFFSSTVQYSFSQKE